MGEQIDTHSGNLNYTYPLVTAQGRASSLPIALSYNSQQWRLDANGTVWDLDEVRYIGFGWTFQFGSVLPYYSDATSATDHYEYQDPSGAIYRLDQNNNGVWSGKLSNYVWYDANTNILHFRDGSFWYIGSVAASAERDAGTYYPTILQDSNGNQITVTYAAGQASIWSNTSSRITAIRRRARTRLHVFVHARSKRFRVSFDRNCELDQQRGILYAELQSGHPELTLFANTTPAVTQTLSSIQNNATNLTTSFTYDPNSGELTQVTFPYGGHIRWTYANQVFTQSTIRTVQNR